MVWQSINVSKTFAWATIPELAKVCEFIFICLACRLKSILLHCMLYLHQRSTFWTGAIWDVRQCASGWCVKCISTFEQLHDIRLHYVYNDQNDTCNLWYQENIGFEMNIYKSCIPALCVDGGCLYTCRKNKQQVVIFQIFMKFMMFTSNSKSSVHRRRSCPPTCSQDIRQNC